MQGDHNKYQTFLELRPKRFEADAIRMLIAQLRACVAALKAAKKAPKPGFGMHIAHLANGEMLGEIAAAKADGVVSFCVNFSFYAPLKRLQSCTASRVFCRQAAADWWR